MSPLRIALAGLLIFAGLSGGTTLAMGLPPVAENEPHAPVAVNQADQQPGAAQATTNKSSGWVSSVNNMIKLAIAIHEHRDEYKFFPAAYAADENDKPLLSWRVLILPYIGQQGLYDRFQLNEPWDSEHNKTLIPLMPEIFATPDSTAGPHKTNYLSVRGEHTFFSGVKEIGFEPIIDGTSNTIMVVEADDDHAVVWTKPDDFPYDEKNPAAGLIGLRPGGFYAVMGDGSVHFIPEDVDVETLRNLMLRNDLGPIDWSQINKQR